MDLLNRLLTLDPSRRINAETALNHPFFAEENESPPKKVSKRAFYLPD
jgi:serine/threonine protein kinase